MQKKRGAEGRLQAGKMVDEKYSLLAVVDGERRPELLLLGHGPILAAGGPSVNFPAGWLDRSAQRMSRIRIACGMLPTAPMRESLDRHLHPADQ